MRMRKKEWARRELSACPFLVGAPEALCGAWRDWFPKTQPLHLELGCGKGPFLAQMGLLHPEINLIGIDLSPDVLGVARREVVRVYGEAGRAVDNVALVAYNIERIEQILGSGDVVDRIYINFCNPWPKKKHQKRRLTFPRLLLKYRAFLRDGGEIWFKTDDGGLYEDTLCYLQEAGFAVYQKTEDLHKAAWEENPLSEHEVKFSAMGIPIKAARARKGPLPQGAVCRLR